MSSLAPQTSDFLKQRQKGKPSKVLLIGGTGSGKTTLVELLLNYEAQCEGEFDLKLVKSMTTKSTSETECSEVPDSFQRGTEAGLRMASDTKASKKYELDFGELIQLEVIDTPGFGDTEGKAKDKIQIPNIIDKVRDENYINCVAIITNGSRSRLTSFIRDILDQITFVLPASILSNIIVVLTNTKNMLEANFDPQILHEEFNLNIETSNIFYLSNPFAMWSKAKYHKVKFPESLANDFINAFELLRNIFDSIKSFPMVLTNSFGDFYQVTESLTTCFDELHMHDHNISKMTNIKQGEILKRYTRVDSEETHITCFLCHSNCHMKCNCPFADLFSVFFCKRFRLKNGLDCSECGHDLHWHFSTHYYYQTEEEIVQTEDSIITADRKAITLAEVNRDLNISKKKIKIVTERVYENLTRFQVMASSFWQNKTRSNAILLLRQTIKSISSIDHEKVMGMLDDACTISQNPFLPDRPPGPMIRWACGILGIKDDNVSEQKIKNAFRSFAKVSHPDNRPDGDDQEFVKLNHARDYLLSLPIVTVKSYMPKSQKS